MKILLIIILPFLFACNNTHNKNDKHFNKKDSVNVYAVKSRSYSSNMEYADSLLNILKNIDRIFFGTIQGLEKNDSMYNVLLCSSESYKDPSFEVFFLPKLKFNEIKNVDMQKYYKLHKNELMEYFNIVLFYYKINDPDTQDDFHDDETKYPCLVNSFLLHSDDEVYLNSKIVNSFKELSEFKSNEIYKIYKNN